MSPQIVKRQKQARYPLVAIWTQGIIASSEFRQTVTEFSYNPLFLVYLGALESILIGRYTPWSTAEAIVPILFSIERRR